jgi:NADH-quinone oxidoreductase subunit K
MTLLVITVALFSLGLYGVLVRRDIISVLASIEVMLAGPLVLLVAAGASASSSVSGEASGAVVQSIGLVVLVVAAAEAAVGLALLVAVARSRKTTRIDELTEVRG